MKKNGLKNNRIVLTLGIMMMLAAVFIMGQSPVSAMVPDSGHSMVPDLGNSSSNINSTLFAYIYGQPTASNPFAGYSIPNQTSVMPPVMFIVAHSFGASTIEISWSGSGVPISQSFSWKTSIPFTPGKGTFLVEITLYSSSLHTSQTMAYNINVMNYTEYISYMNAKNPVTSTVLVPWYVEYEYSEVSAGLAAIMVTIFYFYSQIQWDNKEQKQKFFDIE